jgi:acylglycerol lipase
MPADINLTPTGSNIDVALPNKANQDCKIETPHTPRLTGTSWGIPSQCQAAALLVHGLGAHSGWFEALGQRLKSRTVFALAYDQIGFGKRKDERFFSRHQWILDLEASYRYLQSLVSDKPIYLMGNSMGAVVALKAAIDLKPTGLVMFSPGFDGHPQAFKPWYRVRGLMQALFAPDSEIALPYTTDAVTREESVREWLEQDPQRRFRVPARMLLELLRFTQEVEEDAKKVKCPVLMLTAGVDKIIDNGASDRIFARLSSELKISRCFGQAWHDLMFDQSLDDVVEEVVSFIRQTR